MSETVINPPKQKPAPRWTRRKDFRPKEIMAAALNLFTERGYAATRLEEVAEQAGVTKGTLYLYFTNKEELFKAAVRESVAPAMAQAEQLVGDFSGNSADLVIKLMKYYGSQVKTTGWGNILKLIIAESGNFPELAKFYVTEVMEHSRKVVEKVLQRGIDSGEFRNYGNTAYLARIMAAPISMEAIYEYSLRRHENEPIDPDQFLNTHIQLFMNGLLNKK